MTKSTEQDHVLNAWNLELIKALDDEYFAMCKFLLERCHARKNQTLETTLYVLISYKGVDLRFLGLNGFHPDTVGHGGFKCFSLFLHLQ